MQIQVLQCGPQVPHGDPQRQIKFCSVVHVAESGSALQPTAQKQIMPAVITKCFCAIGAKVSRQIWLIARNYFKTGIFQYIESLFLHFSGRESRSLIGSK